MRLVLCALAGVAVTASLAQAQERKLDMPLGEDPKPKGERVFSYTFYPGLDSHETRTVSVEKAGDRWSLVAGKGTSGKLTDEVTLSLSPVDVSVLEGALAEMKNAKDLPHDATPRTDMSHVTIDVPGRAKVEANVGVSGQSVVYDKLGVGGLSSIVSFVQHFLDQKELAGLKPQPKVEARLDLDGKRVEVQLAPNGHGGEKWVVLTGEPDGATGLKGAKELDLSDSDGETLARDLAALAGPLGELPNDKDHWGANGPFSYPKHFQLTVGARSLEGNVEFQDGVAEPASGAQAASAPLKAVLGDLHHFAALDAAKGKGMTDALDGIH
jgi:hypothetical protein